MFALEYDVEIYVYHSRDKNNKKNIITKKYDLINMLCNDYILKHIFYSKVYKLTML